jgi:hypothetical protein
VTSSRTTDTAADDEQAAGTKADDADTAAEASGDSSEHQPDVDRDSDDAPEETAASTAASTDDADDRAAGDPTGPVGRGRSNVAAGTAAVIGAGLGLASLTGTWLSDLMASRQELIGQINAQTATPEEQVATIYGTPWHTTALFNGIFALVAIIVAGGALALPALGKSDAESPGWVRAVAFGGLALGTIGLAIAAAMWFDVFTELPAVPEA